MTHFFQIMFAKSALASEAKGVIDVEKSIGKKDNSNSKKVYRALTGGAVVEHRSDVEWDHELHRGELLRDGDIQEAGRRHRKQRSPC